MKPESKIFIASITEGGYLSENSKEVLNELFKKEWRVINTTPILKSSGNYTSLVSVTSSIVYILEREII